MKTKTVNVQNYFAFLVINEDRKVFVKWFYFDSGIIEIETWSNSNVVLNECYNRVTDYIVKNDLILWSY